MADLTTTPTSLQPLDRGVLRANISASATSATIEPITKWVNGVETTGGFDSTAAFAIIRDGTGRFEFVSFGAKSVDSTTKVTTLSSMRRGLSPTTAGFTAGTGMSWDAGSEIFVVDYPLLYNNGVTTDSTQTITGDKTFSGAVVFSGSERVPVYADATARDAAILSPSNGMEVYLTTEGKFTDYIGGAWTDRGDTGTANASTAVAGKVEIATDAEIRSETSTGGTGAILAIPASATSVLKDDRIVLKDATELTISSGAITVTQPYHNVDTESDAASDDLDTINAAVGTGEIIVLVANNTGRTVVVKHNTGNIKLADATDFSLDDTEKSITLLKQSGNWIEIARGRGAISSGVYEKVVYCSGASSTNNASFHSSTSQINIDTHTYTIPANDLVSGVAYEFEYVLDVTWTTGTVTFAARLGTTDIVDIVITPAGSDGGVVRGTLYGTAAAGASVAVRGSIEVTYSQAAGDKQGADFSVANVATNGTLVLQLSGQFGSSDSNHEIAGRCAKITKISSSSFT